MKNEIVKISRTYSLPLKTVERLRKYVKNSNRGMSEVITMLLDNFLDEQETK